MIAVIGRTLYRLLCAMTAPNPPIPNLPPIESRPEPAGGDEAAETPSLWFVWEENARRMFWGEQAVRATNRPCWACGNPAGFHTEHLPCSNVPPFKRNAPTLPDGNPYRRTT